MTSGISYSRMRIAKHRDNETEELVSAFKYMKNGRYVLNNLSKFLLHDLNLKSTHKLIGNKTFNQPSLFPRQ